MSFSYCNTEIFSRSTEGFCYMPSPNPMFSVQSIYIATALAILSGVYLRHCLRLHIIKSHRSTMISEHVVTLCCGSESVSSKLAQDTALSPGAAIKELFEKRDRHEKRSSTDDNPLSTIDLERAFACGKWGTTRPSDLFLRASLLQIDVDHPISKQSCLDIS